MRLLVANRGEIAIRIFRACRDLNIETVAVFSDVDRQSPHVTMADHAVRLGPAPSRESYLSIPAVISAARKTGAKLVHPGYGFLAENPVFARACAEASLVFVGPAPEAIEAMGSKTGSRERMEKAGVPVVPGTIRAAENAAELKAFARKAGYPVLLKASAGGGGKGMRRVDTEEDLEAAFARVRSEALASFGDGSVYAEKQIERPRHIEVQVVGHPRDGVVAVGERECSIQRRHQKVVEECPSPAIDDALRGRLFEAAITAARTVGYTSCGTVEFLVAPDRSFYFLEMNTRLQVEHPVTEEVWGVDLAAAMIRIALGEPFPFDPAKLRPRGHAIECRIYAEDARRGFAPSPGRIESMRLPEGPGIRNDVGVEAGSLVPIDYDPMLGKVIAHGADRSAALARLARALSDYEISGVDTTLPLFRALCAESDFTRGAFDVQWLNRRLSEGMLGPEAPSPSEIWLAAAGLAQADTPSPAGSPGESPSHWLQAARREALR